jgi:hypothetical protein
VTPSNGIVVQWRATEGGTTSQIQVPGPTPGAQTYLMVDRWTDTTSHVTYYQALRSTTGAPASWTAIPGSLQQVAGLTGSLLAGMATDSWNQGTAATWTIDNVAISNTGIAPAGACPAGWTCQDIGGATPAGGQSLSGGVWTVQGGGNDIWTTSDSFRLISQSLAADGSVSARVATQSASDPWAKAGVMLRGSNDPGSPYYGALVTPNNGVVVQWRAVAAGNTGQVSIPGVAPKYLKVSRWTDSSTATPGIFLTAYTSPDGTTWTAVPASTQSFNLPGALLAGMAVTSHNGAVLGTVTFDNVALTNMAQPPAGACLAAWTCQDIGGATPAGSQTPANSTGTGWTINGGGGDIWNPADSFRYVTKALPGDGTLTAHVASQTASDPWAKSGLMVRADNTNTSAYFGVFVTPANGIVVQYRATSGDTVNSTTVASVATTAAPVWLRITRVASTNTYTAWYSTDNVTWTQIGTSQVAASLTGTLLEGLAVCSHNTGALSTAVFDTVSP